MHVRNSSPTWQQFLSWHSARGNCFTLPSRSLFWHVWGAHSEFMPLLDRVKDDWELAVYMLKVLCLTSGFNLYLFIYFLSYQCVPWTHSHPRSSHTNVLSCAVLSRCASYPLASSGARQGKQSLCHLWLTLKGSLPFSVLRILSFHTRYLALVKAQHSGDGWFSLQNHMGKMWKTSVMVVQVKPQKLKNVNVSLVQEQNILG